MGLSPKGSSIKLQGFIEFILIKLGYSLEKERPNPPIGGLAR
jgi:hypothetical protein